VFEKVVRPLPKLGVRFFKEYVIDIETTGLSEKEDIIVCIGIADLDKLMSTIYFLNDHTKWKQFHRFCRKKVRELVRKGKVWAYNKSFEEQFLGVKGMHELMCMYKECRFRLTLSSACDEIIHSYKLKVGEGELNYELISGKDVPLLYLKWWVIFRDDEAKRIIIDHNYNDLVRSYIVRIHIGKVAEKISRQLFNLKVIPQELDRIFREYWC